MLKSKKFLIILLTFLLIILTFTSTSYGTEPLSTTSMEVLQDFTVSAPSSDDILVAPNPENTIASADSTNASTIENDLYIYNSDSYILNDIIEGSAFISSNSFSTNPKLNGGIIKGNLFLASKEATISSDVSYSDIKDKYGNYVINSINSFSQINGNAFIYADTFTLEPGSKIEGDLFIAATTVNIEQGSIINGNVYISATFVKLDGQINGSAYISANNFDMNYSAFIVQDLHLKSDIINISGVVKRNIIISKATTITTTSTFRVSGSFTVNDATDLNFSGEVQGNAKINAKNINFIKASQDICSIQGNLEHSTKTQNLNTGDVVLGNVIASEYASSNGSYVLSAALSFLGTLLYVLGVNFIYKRFIPEFTNSTKFNLIKSFLLGLVSIFAVLAISAILFTINIGVLLALFIIIAYLFINILAYPMLVNMISNKINLKMNSVLKMTLITLVLFIIYVIPVIGPILLFITLIISSGNIIAHLFAKNKNK